jgi:hypothetical protein
MENQAPKRKPKAKR